MGPASLVGSLRQEQGQRIQPVRGALRRYVDGIGRPWSGACLLPSVVAEETAGSQSGGVSALRVTGATSAGHFPHTRFSLSVCGEEEAHRWARVPGSTRANADNAFAWAWGRTFTLRFPSSRHGRSGRPPLIVRRRNRSMALTEHHMASAQAYCSVGQYLLQCASLWVRSQCGLALVLSRSFQVPFLVWE